MNHTNLYYKQTTKKLGSTEIFKCMTMRPEKNVRNNYKTCLHHFTELFTNRKESEKSMVFKTISVVNK